MTLKPGVLGFALLVSVVSSAQAALPGDENGDRSVSLVELTRAVLAWRGLADAPASADTNGDGVISWPELKRVVRAYRRSG